MNFDFMTISGGLLVDAYDMLTRLEYRVDSWGKEYADPSSKYNWLVKAFSIRSKMRDALRKDMFLALTKDDILYIYMALQYLYMDLVSCGDFISISDNSFSVFNDSECHVASHFFKEFNYIKQAYEKTHNVYLCPESIIGAQILISEFTDKELEDCLKNDGSIWGDSYES